MLQADKPFPFGLKWTTVALNLQKFQTGLPIPFQKRMQCLKKWKQIGYTALLSVPFTLTIFFDMQDTNVIALFWDITRNIPEFRIISQKSADLINIAAEAKNQGYKCHYYQPFVCLSGDKFFQISVNISKYERICFTYRKESPLPQTN